MHFFFHKCNTQTNRKQNSVTLSNIVNIVRGHVHDDTTLCDKVCQWLATGLWFSLGTPVSST